MDHTAEKHNQALKLYNQGLTYYNARNWAKAMELFWEAIKKWPENPEFRSSLDKAEAELRREREQQAVENAVEETRKAFIVRRNEDLVEQQRLEFVKMAQSKLTAQKEQEEFDKMNAAWLKRQQEYIRQAAQQDKRWKSEVVASIKAIRVPSPIFTPKRLDDLSPGDILLVAPDSSLTAKSIISGDPLYRALDYFSGGSVAKPELKKGRVSHALAVVKAVNGEILFLDHTLTDGGSRILNREQYLKKYGDRGIYVARPQAKVDGRELWQAAREAALSKNGGYGLTGKNVVCSERAAIAVARATRLPLQTQHHRIGKFLGPIDITPSDFFDGSHTGKYFLVSTIPILPSAERSKP